MGGDRNNKDKKKKDGKKKDKKSKESKKEKNDRRMKKEAKRAIREADRSHPTYTLTYFKAAGNGQGVRLALAAANANWDNHYVR
jgi:hypothetical protein